MKQLVTSLLLVLITSYACAQTLTFDKVRKATVLRNSDAIKEGSEVKGYYFFYATDKIDRKTNEYVLQILDDKLNKLKEIRFQDSKYLQLLESSFNGNDLVFMFYNTDTNIMEYQVYGANGDKKFSYTKSFSKKDEAYLKKTYFSFSDDDDDNYKGLYPIDGKGFISNIPSRDNRDYTFEISYIGTDAKKMWSYVPNMDGKIFVGDYLGTFNNVVFVEMLRYSSIMDRNPESTILGLSVENGRLLFQKTTEGKNTFYPISMSLLNNGKAYIYGEYFDKGGNVMKDKSRGFGFWGIDEKGIVGSEKYISWSSDLGKFLDVSSKGKIEDFGYMFLHNMVQTDDGNIFAIGEGFKKEASALGIAATVLSRGQSDISTVKLKITDMMVISFDKDLNVKKATIYPKNSNNVLLESGSEFVSTPMLGKYAKYFYGGFDYCYTQINKDHSAFSVCYSDYERGKNYKGATFNSISYNEGKFSQDKIQTKSNASRAMVLPASQGQVLLVDYYKKDKRLEIHLEKLN